MKITILFALLIVSMLFNLNSTLKTMNKMKSLSPHSGWIKIYSENSIVNFISVSGLKVNTKQQTKNLKYFMTNINVGNLVEFEIESNDIKSNISFICEFLYKNNAGQDISSKVDSTWICNNELVVEETIKDNKILANFIFADRLIKSKTKSNKLICRGILQQNKVPGEISLFFNDSFQNLYINNEIQSISYLPEKNKILTLKTIMGTDDEIKICSKNNSTDLNSNKGFLYASISFVNNEGNLQVMRTNEEWICDGSKAKVIDIPDYKLLTIENAIPIWSTNNKSACCSIILSKERKEGRFNLQVSNYLEKLIVNEDELQFGRIQDENWMETKEFSLSIRSGDVIKISLSNKNKQPSFMGTIYYINNLGYMSNISTSQEYFKCENSQAVEIKNESKFCSEGKIETEAKWISTKERIDNITCSITLP